MKSQSIDETQRTSGSRPVIAAPLIRDSWFPRDRAFEATAAAVRVLVYSEAPVTDFVIASLDIYRLRPQTDIDAGR